MKKVKHLLFIFTDDFNIGKNTKKEEFDYIITFVKERGCLLKDSSISYSSVAVEFELQKEISIDECINLIFEIESVGKYEVPEFTFCTENSGYDMQQPPCAEISLEKSNSK